MVNEEILPGSKRTQVDLAVTCQGMTLKVSAGSFRVCNKDYSLDEETVFTLDAFKGRSALRLSLAEDKETGEAFVMADHVEEVGGQFDFYPWPSKGPYELLHLLAISNLPAGTKDLAEVEVKVFLRKGSLDG